MIAGLGLLLLVLLINLTIAMGAFVGVVASLLVGLIGGFMIAAKSYAGYRPDFGGDFDLRAFDTLQLRQRRAFDARQLRRKGGDR